MIPAYSQQTMNPLKERFICLGLILLFGFYSVNAQDEDGDKRPVRAPFESALLIDNQTFIVPDAKTLEFDMIHRFGAVERGITDIYGIYAPGSNIRLAFTYSIIENLSVGVGITKLNEFVDFNAKYAILKQTRDWSMPLSLTYFGNVAIDGRDKVEFEASSNPAINRLSYFHQFIAGTRINKNLSVQIAPSFSYFNKVDKGMNNFVLGVGLGGRYKVGSQTSIIFDYNQPLSLGDETETSKSSLGLGAEISTSTHAFQVFVSTFKSILPQYNMRFNNNELDKTGILIGFNMTRLWSF